MSGRLPDALSQAAPSGPDLRPLHLPPEPGWFPPAPGWWLLALLLLAGLILLGGWWRRRGRRRWVAQAPRRLLNRLRTDPRRVQDPQGWLVELSMLLRRAAVRADPGSAGLQSTAWADWLDRRLGRVAFRSGPGSTLIDGPYRRQAEVDVETLLALADELLRRLEDGARA